MNDKQWLEYFYTESQRLRNCLLKGSDKTEFERNQALYAATQAVIEHLEREKTHTTLY